MTKSQKAFADPSFSMYSVKLAAVITTLTVWWLNFGQITNPTASEQTVALHDSLVEIFRTDYVTLRQVPST